MGEDMKPFGYGYIPKPITREEIKENLRRWAWFGEAHVDNCWSETLKLIENQEEMILMMKTQLLIRKDLIEKLKSGPGGIMEMKQTIADKEAEIARLQQYESMVHYISNDYIELSYEKAQCQRDDWYKRCNKTITGI